MGEAKRRGTKEERAAQAREQKERARAEAAERRRQNSAKRDRRVSLILAAAGFAMAGPLPRVR
jgi:succinyl-CoA synthetase beta subunit